MPDAPAIAAVSIGTIAAGVLAEGGDAEVIAAHERSVYLMTPRGIVCMGLDSLGRGPINVLVAPGARGGEAPTASTWLERLRSGAKGVVVGSAVHFDAEDVSVDWSGATVWRPSPFVACRDYQAAAAVIADAVQGYDWQRDAWDGVGPYVFAGARDAVPSRWTAGAGDLIATLREQVPAVLQSQTWDDASIRAATLLLGLGPGLTPSGDDLLGGLFLALAARGQTALRDDLFDAVADELDALTVPISAMHLAVAADGMASEAMHQFIDAAMSGDAAKTMAGLETVARHGATSGLDTLAGVMIGFDA